MPSMRASDEELTAARTARATSRRVEKQERYLHYLNVARRTRLDNELDATKIDEVIQQATSELATLTGAPGGKIQPRKRPHHSITSTGTLFIDECGSHSLSAKEKFEAFCLTGVLVLDADSSSVDRRWKRWKLDHLGSARKKVHEPDIRDGNGSFWCDGNKAKRERAITGLDKILSVLDYTVFSCVVHRPRYRASIGEGPWDESLPQHIYLMAIHFLMERVALALDTQFGGCKVRVVVESRGYLEDARMQYEFARLFLDGTTYISATYFRHQFFPGMEFRSKEDNSTGLQIADLAARPCSEKVLEPASTPARWLTVRRKLCPGRETSHSVLGLKIVPWDESYRDIWDKS